jgi:putative peptide zinc metalloprotease protein
VNPKLGSDVQFFPMENGIYHVYNGASGRHFKLGAQEVAWLRMLDGTKPKDDYRGAIPEEFFDRFFAQAEALGLIGAAAGKKDFDFFRIKVATFRPQRLLDSIAGGARLYRSCLIGTFPILLLLNIFLLVRMWPLMTKFGGSLKFTGWLIPVYLVAMLVIGLIHETSHAVVARSYGVHVPSIGFMLMYLHPAFFADVSGINLLKSSRARIGVLLAGIMANNALASLALLAFPFVTLASHTAGSVVAAFALLNMLLLVANLVPFLEYDGHYVLLILLSEPNLVDNAKRALREGRKLRFEQLAYVALYHAMMVSTVFLALFRARTWVLNAAPAVYVNWSCVALMAAAWFAIARRTLTPKA